MNTIAERPPSTTTLSRISGRIGIPGDIASDLVLLADRDVVTRGVLATCLRRSQCEVLMCGDAVEAWTAFAVHPACRIVVVDWQLEAGGIKLAQAIRAAERPGYTYVIVTIRNELGLDTNAVMASGADDVLIKPFFHEVLAQRLHVARRMLRLEDRLRDRQHELEEANARIEALHERTRSELIAAVDMQRALLPEPLKHLEQVRMAWHYHPSTELGGDLIGCFPISPRHLAFYVLDVSGHGISAALLAVQINRFLAPSAGGADLLCDAHGDPVAPSVVVRALNRRFPMSRRQQFFTIVYGTLNIMDGTFQWCSAGHPWPIRSTEDGAAPLPTKSNTAIGWLPDGKLTFKDQAITLQPGERVLMYSDGAIEATDPGLNQFGEGRLAELLHRESASEPALVLDAIAEVLDAWSAGGPERDDLSLLLLTWMGPRIPE